MSTKPAKARQKQKRDPQQAPQLKIVIRNLPPSLPEKVFHESIAAWHKAFDWSDYIAGKLSSSRDKSDRFSRAYLRFRKREDLNDFGKRYNGHLFISADGKEYRASVEVAPYQKCPRPLTAAAKAKDTLAGTIADDPDFKAFLISLATPVQALPEEPQVAPKITPLIEYLRVQKVKNEAKAKARKAKEAATKAKQQEEKKKSAQALADATTTKLREKASNNSKANGKSATKETTANKAETGTTENKKSRHRQPKAKNGATSTSSNSAQDGKPAQSTSQPKAAGQQQTTTTTTPSSAAQQRLPKSQNGKSRPAQAGESKAPKATKNKRKENKQSGNSNGKSSVASRNAHSAVDISGPTPAEMAALARAKT